MNALPSSSQAFANEGLVNTANLTDGKVSSDVSRHNRHYEPSFRGYQVEACQTFMGPSTLSSSPKSSSSHCENNNKTQGNNSLLSLPLDDFESLEQWVSTEDFFDVNYLIESQSASDTQLISSGCAAEIEGGDKRFDLGGQLKLAEHPFETRRVYQREASGSIFLGCQSPSASSNAAESDTKQQSTSTSPEGTVKQPVNSTGDMVSVDASESVQGDNDSRFAQLGGSRPQTVNAESFTTKNSLEIHFRKHTGENPFKCPDCGKRFPYKSILTRHSRKHTGEKPFQCKKCSKRFVCNFSLQNHLRRHAGEKPYTCEQCSKNFTTKSELNNHFKTHSTEKSYICEQCSKRFASNKNLQRHFRRHAGEKPFQCEKCSKRFVCNQNLQNHLRRHTGEKPYECEQCYKRFTTKSNLNVHSQIHTRAIASI